MVDLARASHEISTRVSTTCEIADHSVHTQDRSAGSAAQDEAVAPVLRRAEVPNARRRRPRPHTRKIVDVATTGSRRGCHEGGGEKIFFFCSSPTSGFDDEDASVVNRPSDFFTSSEEKGAEQKPMSPRRRERGPTRKLDRAGRPGGGGGGGGDAGRARTCAQTLRPEHTCRLMD